MHFLPYFVYMLLNRGLNNNLDTCRNDTSGENGICLSDWYCNGIAKGMKVGNCNTRSTDGICCKITLIYGNDTLDLSSFIITNIDGLKVGERWKKTLQTGTKYQWGSAYINPNHYAQIAEIKIGPGAYGNMAIPYCIKYNLKHDIPQKAIKNRNIINHLRRRAHDKRRLVEMLPTNEMRRSVETHATHDMRRPVETHATHDMRRPVETHPTHDMRRPVQTHPTHDMRRPLQTHPTHDMREPVQTDPTHDMRKPVKVNESHDLRWPVVQGYDHDLRNPVTVYDSYSEDDIFRSGDAGKKLINFLSEYTKSGSKNNGFDPNDKFIYQFLQEDDYLQSNCTDRNESSSGDERVKTNYKDLFNNSCRVCGLSFNKSTQESIDEKKASKWPWMVSLHEYIVNGYYHKCGGSLINDLWVITAAHCVYLRLKWDFMLLLGKEDLNETQQYLERYVDRISIHPKFNNVNLDHDIALLRMEFPVSFQHDIIPICLPWRSDETKNKIAVVLGWRLTTERRILNNALKEKTVPVITNKECEVIFSKNGSIESIEQSFVCARIDGESHDSCTGDSGGPLAILDDDGRWSLTGLYSWGKTCKTPKQPDVYIRISSYANWIEDTISCYEHYIRLME